MNEDYNNNNQESLNIEENNIQNNYQPQLDNTNYNQQEGSNISQPQQMINQTNINQGTFQKTNLEQNENYNNQNVEAPPKNKKNLGLIIGIIAIILIIIVIVVFSKNNIFVKNNDNAITNNSTTSGIKQIDVSKGNVVALMNNGDLYSLEIDDDSSIQGKKPQKIASDVVKFYNTGDIVGIGAVYYIDKKQDLYYIGESYNGGGTDTPEKDDSGVTDIAVFNNLCGIAIKNNEVYAKNNSGSYDYCGLNSYYKDFTKVADNASKVFVNAHTSAYISTKDELYIKTSNTEYKKVIDNVETVSEIGFYTTFILTKDNKLYLYTNKNYYKGGEFELTLLREDVEELNKEFFKTKDGDYYVFDTKKSIPFIKNEATQFCEAEDTIYYGVLNLKDIKDVYNILYYTNETLYFSPDKRDSQKKLVYLSKDNKIKLLDESGNETIDYNVDNLGIILEFVNKKNIIESK